MAYLLDSDVLIQAKNMHYAFDLVPGFWDWLLEANAAERVFSVQKVAEELRDGGDELADWVKERDATFFLEPDDDVVASLQVASAWAANAPGYEQAAVADFLQSADYYLVAHAHAHGHVVVTHERSQPDAKKVIKIPDACTGLHVQSTNPFEMLRAEGAKFVKGGPS